MLVGAAILLGAVVALIAIFSLSRSGGTGNAEPPNSVGTSSAPASASSSRASTSVSPAASRSPSRSAVSSSSPSSTSRADNAIPSVLASCRVQVSAGEALIGPAKTSAHDWKLHTQAQINYDEGRASAAHAEAIWTQTKALGPRDATVFATADKSYTAHEGGCAGANTVTGLYADAAKSCAQRASALAAFRRAAVAVDHQWAAHVAMMKSKPQPGEGNYTEDWPTYLRRWRSMVRKAAPEFRRYDSALAALGKAPACPGG